MSLGQRSRSRQASSPATSRPSARGASIIQSSGLTRLKLNRETLAAPLVTVTEKQFRRGDFDTGESAELPAFEADDLIDPGETITDSLTFVFSLPTEVTLGWTADFTFAVKRPLRRKTGAKGYWWWSATPCLSR